MRTLGECGKHNMVNYKGRLITNHKNYENSKM